MKFQILFTILQTVSYTHLDDRRIKAAFPDIWGKYVKQYKKQIAGYLEKYYEAELCLAAVAGDGVDFAYQYSCCGECYEMYDIRCV